jgi:hypothetical protein
VPSPSDQHNFNPRCMSPPQCGQIVIRNPELRIQQRPIDISSDQSDGIRRLVRIFPRRRNDSLAHLFIVAYKSHIPCHCSNSKMRVLKHYSREATKK